jgi:hypothetical protein
VEDLKAEGTALRGIDEHMLPLHWTTIFRGATAAAFAAVRRKPPFRGRFRGNP